MSSRARLPISGWDRFLSANSHQVLLAQQVHFAECKKQFSGARVIQVEYSQESTVSSILLCIFSTALICAGFGETPDTRKPKSNQDRLQVGIGGGRIHQVL